MPTICTSCLGTDFSCSLDEMASLVFEKMFGQVCDRWTDREVFLVVYENFLGQVLHGLYGQTDVPTRGHTNVYWVLLLLKNTQQYGQNE